MTHSKGPWMISTVGPWNVQSIEGKRICVMDQGATPDQSYANALVLAAAPSLLKGVKLALMEFDRISYQKRADRDIIDMLERVVAVAEGKNIK